MWAFILRGGAKINWYKVVGIFAGGMESRAIITLQFIENYWLELKELVDSWGVNVLFHSLQICARFAGVPELILGWTSLRGLYGCLNISLKEVCVSVPRKDYYRESLLCQCPNYQRSKPMEFICGVPFRYQLKVGKRKEHSSQEQLSSGPSWLTP